MWRSSGAALAGGEREKRIDCGEENLKMSKVTAGLCCIAGQLTLTTGHWFYWAKMRLFSQISKILRSISQITEPIPGMFVVIWMHFPWWFQIWSWNSKIFVIFEYFVKFLACRLHSPAAWNALKHACTVNCSHYAWLYNFPLINAFARKLHWIEWSVFSHGHCFQWTEVVS